MATNWTLTEVLKQLNSGSLWSGDTITYSFPTSATNMYTGSGEAGGFKPLSSVQITMAEYALTGWDDLIAATFAEGTGKTNIEIANTTTGIDYAHAYFPNTGSVWFNPNYGDVKNPVVGDYGYATFIHELGHALGLDHMGEYNGSGSWEPSCYQDTTVLSIMSYFGPDHYDGEGKVMWADWVKGGTTYSAQTPMLNDVMAVQAMYGADTTTRTGATVYGFNSNISGNAGKIFDFDVNGNPIVCIYDAGGNDTLDLSGFSTKSTISLVAGTFSNCNEMTNNISIAYSATIENAVGGSANDTITGNDAGNVLTGGRGNDTIDGGAGSDIAVFSGAYADYTVVSNGNGSYTVTDNAGNDGKDTLSSIELLRFSDQDVTDGDDSDTAPILVQALDDQNADAGALFSFTIPAGTFADPNGDGLTYSAKLAGGGSLPAWLSFDASAGTFSGTPGAADAGTLSIVVSASDGGEQASDTFEIVVGGDDGGDGSIILGDRRGNHLVGDDGAETLRALGGKDKILAGAGGDTLEGGTGRDLLWGEEGSDIFKFGKKNGMDDIKDFSLGEGDRIDLSDVGAITDYSDLVDNHLFSYLGDAYIRTSKGHDILVVGIDAADLMSESNFIF